MLLLISFFIPAILYTEIHGQSPPPEPPPGGGSASATAWKVAAATAVVGWLASPVITLLLPKIISCLGFDASEKLRDLKIRIIPELQKTLREVDQARMLQRREVPDVSTLDEMAAMLRRAQEEVEDILDDAQDIDLYRNRWLQRLYGCVKIFSRYVAPFVRIILLCVLVASMWALVQLAGMVSYIYRAVESSMRILSGCWQCCNTGTGTVEPVDSAATSHAHAVDIADSDNEPVPEAAPSHSASDAEAVSESTPSESASKEELVSEATFSDSASDEEAVSEATPSESPSNEELVSEATFSDSASDEEAVSEATPSESPSKEELVSEATFSDSASDEEAVSEATPSYEELVSEATFSDSASVPVTAHTCSSLDVFNNCCRSIFYWLLDAYEKACFYRDAGAGITSYHQVNATTLDFFVTAISRRTLKKRIEKLESTVGELKKSPLLGAASKSAPDNIANKNRSRIRTTSNRKVFGRYSFRDYIMAKLRETPHGDAPSSSTSPCYSAIGIYGVAGSGKTTFARYIRDYIKEECKEELFDAIMCIHVSETFRVDDIFHEMLKDITNDQYSNISDGEELKEKLKEELGGKRFFLILDDLWVKSRNDPQLEELISPLNVGLKGSKIMVTARTKVAAGVLRGTSVTMEMPDLNEDEYLSMFMHYALGGTSVNDEEFIPVGRVIAEKLHRSPIAAVIVAGRLGTNIGCWKNTAELDMLNDTMDALWWGYQRLSLDIRRCFEYSNIFPRRFKMKKDDLVRLWIAQGFVRTSCAREDMEDVAEGYIRELVSCSFLQSEENQFDGECFIIHDLLHDLADMVTTTDFFRIENERSQRGEGWKGDVPRDVRHLFVQNYDKKLITEKILGLKNLRTLIVYVIDTPVGKFRPVKERVIDGICKRLPKLRVLVIAFCQHAPIILKCKFSVPESISHLKHLRYLAFRTSIYSEIILPSTINELQHIQLLDFGHGCIAESEFKIGDHANLRYIIHGPGVQPANIGRLISLKKIGHFKVMKKQGYEAKQLRDLNKLRGCLDIRGLRNVRSKKEALEANLAAKEQITEMELRWDRHDNAWNNEWCSPEVEAEVLEGLCPPVGLQKLSIMDYQGSRYPDWMLGKQNHGLQTLMFSFCTLRPAPELVEAFPHLRALKLWSCGWEALPSNMKHLKSLKELVISRCTDIWYLPTLPLSLEKLRIEKCNDELVESCQTAGHPNWQKIKHIRMKIIW